MKTLTRITLTKLKRYPKLARHFAGKYVHIWSGEHQAWWRHRAQGYTTGQSSAAMLPFEEAHSATSHCGPEKKIEFIVAQLYPGMRFQALFDHMSKEHNLILLESEMDAIERIVRAIPL